LAYNAYRKYVEDPNCYDHRSEKKKQQWGTKLRLRQEFSVLLLILILVLPLLVLLLLQQLLLQLILLVGTNSTGVPASIANKN
jgi:hypothetical protein